MAVISVSLPDDLLAVADRCIDARGFQGRSELVRAALRDFVARATDEPTGPAPCAATLTLLYSEGAERKIGEVRHDHTDVVASMMHGHTHEGCVELFLLRGPADRVRAFADALRGTREARLVALTYTDADAA